MLMPPPVPQRFGAPMPPVSPGVPQSLQFPMAPPAPSTAANSTAMAGGSSGQVPGAAGPQAQMPGAIAPGAVPGAPMPQQPVMLHDVMVRKKKTHGQVRIASVPPEEFGVSRTARSILIQEASYCFHAKLTFERELIADGYDSDQIANLPTDKDPVQGSEEQRRDTVAESSEGVQGIGTNKSNRQHIIVEHYCWLDLKGDGKAKRYKVVTGGGAGAHEILRKQDGTDAIEKINRWPFATMTPSIITHRFFGRSIADMTVDVQEIKTALLRAILDNTYRLNNARTEVSEDHITESTIDDLLSNRIGGIVRTKTPGGLNVLQNQPIGDAVMGVMEYMDAIKEARTGVSRQATGIDANSLEKINIGEGALLQMASAAQSRIKMIARIFAETGIRDLMLLVHATARENATAEDTFHLRGQWVTINPRNWQERRDMTVVVGLGTGDKPQQIAFLNAILGIQKDAIQYPELGLIKAGGIYATLKKMLVAGGIKDVESQFTDRYEVGPDGQPKNVGQPRPDPKILAIQAQAQADDKQAQASAQAAQMKAQTDAQVAQMRAQSEAQATQAEAATKIKIAQASAQADIQKTQADIAAQNAKTQSDIALARQQFEFNQRIAVMEFQLKERDRQAAEAQAREAHQQKMLESLMAMHAQRQDHLATMTEKHEDGKARRAAMAGSDGD